jgi:hypothetical protein
VAVEAVGEVGVPETDDRVLTGEDGLEQGEVVVAEGLKRA